MSNSNTFDVEVLEKDSPDELIARLKDWLANDAPQTIRGKLSSFNSPSAAAGRSGDTFIISIDHIDRSIGERKYVLRAELGSTACPESNFDNMVTAHKVLGSLSGFDVPACVHHEPSGEIIGGPFFLMAFSEGVAAPDSPPYTTSGWVYEATPEERRSICESGIEFLVKLHQLDWRSLGLDSMIKTGPGSSQAERHLNSLIEIYDNALDGKRYEVGAEAIEWLKANLPEKENLCMTWGDCRPGNALWKDARLSAALDWEMCCISEPGLDIGLWLAYETAVTDCIGVPRLEGLMQRDEFLAEYEKLSGGPLANFEFYEIFSAFRAYVIVTDMVKLYERQGQAFFGPSMDARHNPLALVMRSLIDRVK